MWKDPGCANAQRRLNAGVTHDEGKAALRALRRRPEEYALRILELKASQLASGDDQRQQCLSLIERVTFEYRLSLETGYELMDHETFLAYQIYSRAQTPETAELRYQAAIANKDVYRCTVKGTFLIAVECNLRIIQQKTISKQRELKYPEQVLKTDEEKASGLKRSAGVLNQSPGAALFEPVDGFMMVSGTPAGLSDWEEAKRLRSLGELPVDAMIADSTKPDPEVMKSDSSLTPTEKAIKRQALSLSRQGKLLELEALEVQVADIIKTTKSKFTDKLLEGLLPEHRADFDTSNIVSSMEDCIATSRVMRSDIHAVKVDDLTQDVLATASTNVKTMMSNVKAFTDHLAVLTTRFGQRREETKKRKREETKRRLSSTRAKAQDFTPQLPPSVSTLVIREFDSSGMVPIDDQTMKDADLSMPLMFSSISDLGKALYEKLAAWPSNGDKFVDAAKASLQSCRTALSAVNRFPPPAATNKDLLKAITDADWFKKIDMANPALGLGTPLDCAERGLPWALALQSNTYVGNENALPLTGFGQFYLLRTAHVFSSSCRRLSLRIRMR